MQKINPIAIPPEEKFVVGESDMHFFFNRPQRVPSGVLMYCMQGEAKITIDLKNSRIRTDSCILLMPNTILMFSEASSDFKMMFFAFSHELIDEISFRMDIRFFHFLKENPIFNHLSDLNIEEIKRWFEAVRYNYEDKENIFRSTIIKNRLQNALLEICDKGQRTQSQLPYDNLNRKNSIFHKFISLLQTYGNEQHEVSFYADKLCISTRYLSAITRAVANKSAKEIIDQWTLLMIKIMLQSTDLTIQEIAYSLQFHDQSYMGRFFKKYTGDSPAAYRKKRN